MDLGGEAHDATVSGTLAFLFFALAPNRYGNLAWYPARRLNELFIPREINLGDRQYLYSLRHSVSDCCGLLIIVRV